MGGYSSGRHGGKRTTDDMHILDIRKIQRAGLLKPGGSFSWQWTRGGNKIAAIDMRADTDRVTLIYRSCGGAIRWQGVRVQALPQIGLPHPAATGRRPGHQQGGQNPQAAGLGRWHIEPTRR